MDSALAAALIGAIAGLIAACIGGMFALAGAERALNGTLAAARVQRQADYLASLQAVKREIDLNQQLVAQVPDLPARLPLPHIMLDSFLAADERGIPAPTLKLSLPIARYNALAEMGRALYQASHPVPKELESQLDATARELDASLRAASTSLAQTIGGMETWVKQAQGVFEQLQSYRWYRRLWVLLTNPRLLPPAPPGFPT